MTVGLLTKASARHLLGLMQRQEVSTKLGAVVPSGIVAHKTGENGTVSHDIGYYFIAGSDLSIGVFAARPWCCWGCGNGDPGDEFSA